MSAKSPTAAERTFAYVVLIVIVTVVTIPLIWLVFGALKSDRDFAAMTPQLFPDEFQWKNFLEVFQRQLFLRGFRNSLVMATMYTSLGVFGSSLAGYAFARIYVVEREAIFTFLFLTMFLPNIVTLIPSYLLFNFLGIADSFWPWVLWGIGGHRVVIFLFRQFFAGMPASLEDAAMIDGCGPFRTFLFVMAPNASSVYVLSVIFLFTFVWSDFLTPFLFLPVELQPLSVVIQTGLNPPYTAYGIMDIPIKLAATLYFILPILVFFFFMQKRIMKGVATTGLKG
jgi:multiple sugar transport system permease protein